MRKYFSNKGKNYYWCENKHGDYGFGGWRFFRWRSMLMHVHLRILRIYFLWYQDNSHPENFHQSNSPLVNPPGKFPPGILPPLFLNIPAQFFFLFFFFFSLLLPLSLILLKRLFCNSMFQMCWKTINETVGNIPGENFLGGNFPGVSFPGGSLMGGNFSGGNSPGGIFLEPFASCNVSTLVFQKIINKYSKIFNKKIYTLNS